MDSVKLLKSRDVLERRRHGTTKLWEDIKRGILTPPIKRGPRENIWPEEEIERIVRAEIRGDTEAQRRELVRQLLEARKVA